MSYKRFFEAAESSTGGAAARTRALHNPFAADPPRGPIKMVVSDFDGTLLPESSGDLPRDVIEMAHRLHEEHILFAAASGRQFYNLHHIMEDAADQMFFLPENGSLVFDRDECIGMVPIPPEDVRTIVDEIMAQEGCEAVISGVKMGYVMPPAHFIHNIDQGTRNFIEIQSIDEIDDTIIKISAFRPKGIEPVRKYFLERFGERFHAAISGNAWQDFTLGNKGRALALLLDKLGLKPEEVLAFGDNFNDIQMLELAGHSYVTRHAAPEVKAAADGEFDTVPAFVDHYLETRTLP